MSLKSGFPKNHVLSFPYPIKIFECKLQLESMVSLNLLDENGERGFPFSRE